MIEPTELLPCPFCGGPVELEETTIYYNEMHGNRQWWGVVCRNTTNRGGSCAIQQRPSASKEAAVERWNRRTPQPTQAQAGTGVKAVHQFRKKHCADWYDGFADHSDGGGPYEERTLYTVGAVPLDEARRLFDAGWKAAALFCDREDVVADGIIGFGACPQFEAAFSAANGIKGGQHGSE